MTNATTNNHDPGERFDVMPARTLPGIVLLPGDTYEGERDATPQPILLRRFGKMAQLMDTFDKHGDKFFAPDTMRFWRTRFLGGPRPLIAGCVFVTSEPPFSNVGRVFAVRMAYYHNGTDGIMQPRIMTIASYLETSAQARRIAYALGTRLDNAWHASATAGRLLTATQYQQPPTPPLRTVLSAAAVVEVQQ